MGNFIKWGNQLSKAVAQAKEQDKLILIKFYRHT
jgi:hypothetical protein